MWLTPFSMALYGANALRVPVVTITSSLASAMVPPPLLPRAMMGTWARSPSKHLALARMETMTSVFTRILHARLDAGPLEAVCPLGPMPPANASLPSAALIFSSKASHSACRPAAFPSEMGVFLGGCQCAGRTCFT